MSKPSRIWFVSCVVLLCALCGAAEAQQKSTTSQLRPEHWKVVQTWLAQSPRRANLRVASEKDCRDREGLTQYRREQGKGYQPYYVAGDFNGDQHEDFAVAVVNDRRRRAKFSFAIFNGPFGSGVVPAYAEENLDLGELGFFWGNDNNNGESGSDGDESYLILGEFQGDSVCVMYHPRGKKYVP
ncbi:MAG: hypothetical protein ACREBG_19625 [Pyrinomonadaceae bacterium]